MLYITLIGFTPNPPKNTRTFDFISRGYKKPGVATPPTLSIYAGCSPSYQNDPTRAKKLPIYNALLLTPYPWFFGGRSPLFSPTTPYIFLPLVMSPYVTTISTMTSTSRHHNEDIPVYPCHRLLVVGLCFSVSCLFFSLAFLLLPVSLVPVVLSFSCPPSYLSPVGVSLLFSCPCGVPLVAPLCFASPCPRVT